MDSFNVPRKVNRQVVKAIHKLSMLASTEYVHLEDIVYEVKHQIRNGVPVSNVDNVISQSLNNLCNFNVIQRQGDDLFAILHCGLIAGGGHATSRPLTQQPGGIGPGIRGIERELQRNRSATRLDPYIEHRQVSDDSMSGDDTERERKKYQSNNRRFKKTVKLTVEKESGSDSTISEMGNSDLSLERDIDIFNWNCCSLDAEMKRVQASGINDLSTDMTTQSRKSCDNDNFPAKSVDKFDYDDIPSTSKQMCVSKDEYEKNYADIDPDELRNIEEIMGALYEEDCCTSQHEDYHGGEYCDCCGSDSYSTDCIFTASKTSTNQVEGFQQNKTDDHRQCHNPDCECCGVLRDAKTDIASETAIGNAFGGIECNGGISTVTSEIRTTKRHHESSSEDDDEQPAKRLKMNNSNDKMPIEGQRIKEHVLNVLSLKCGHEVNLIEYREFPFEMIQQESVAAQTETGAGDELNSVEVASVEEPRTCDGAGDGNSVAVPASNANNDDPMETDSSDAEEDQNENNNNSD